MTRTFMENYLELCGLGFTMRVALERDFNFMSIIALKPHKRYTMLGFIRNNTISKWSRKIYLMNLPNTDVISSLTFCLENSYVVGHPVVMPRCPESGSTEVRLLTNGRDHYFWSFDPSGSTPLSRRVCGILGLPNYRMDVRPGGPRFYDYHHEEAKYLQEIQDFDPLTQDFARASGLPLVETLSPSENFHPDAFDVWLDAILSKMSDSESDSESVYEDASPQPQTILFPIPGVEQKMNGTAPENPEDSDLNELLQALNQSLGSALIVVHILFKRISHLGWVEWIEINRTFVGGLIPLSQTLVITEYTLFVGFAPDVSIWVGMNKE
ncbi:hypothetical protein K435DRAFT_802138 [Dendrothele bispora CBS 962.96]|uniref:Uncharacterized protein n=1 Tax=Dendrothele bispora (strain CBS 962.96) TaxID=1314807 RepID=A0A4S8LNE4_DENBC|nr:hypothetical protein K435DRAFT_802138 [Dendrothele bispora CBS 962.96]